MLVICFNSLLSNNRVELLTAVLVHFVLGDKHNNNNFIWWYSFDEPNWNQLCNSLFLFRVHGVWVCWQSNCQNYHLGQGTWGLIQGRTYPCRHLYGKNENIQAAQKGCPSLSQVCALRGKESGHGGGSENDGKDSRGAENITPQKCLWKLLFKTLQNFYDSWYHQDFLLSYREKVHPSLTGFQSGKSSQCNLLHF